MKKKILSILVWLWLLLLLASCATVIPRPAPIEEPTGFQKVPLNQWPDLFDDLEYKGLERAVLQSMAYLKTKPSEQVLLLGTRRVSTSDLEATLSLFLEILKEEDGPNRERRLKRNFDLYRLTQGDHPFPLLITGYFEPTLKGSRLPSPRFRYPVYRLPDDLLTIHPEKFSAKIPPSKWVGRIQGKQVVPYYTRQEIDQEGRLSGKNLEILWVEDPVKLFFLHIQGSGEVSLEDGSVVKLGYQGTNGHPYFALGRELIRQGILQPDQVSMQSIYAYLHSHPSERQALTNLNPSYIFFREVRGGPFGSLGRPLTEGRSAAMDLKLFPPAGLAWLKGVQPVIDNQGKIHSWKSLGRWVCLQDSGGAIKGPSRIDLFLGKGPEAALIAGHLNHQGAIYFLIKKTQHLNSVVNEKWRKTDE